MENLSRWTENEELQDHRRETSTSARGNIESCGKKNIEGSGGHRYNLGTAEM